MVWVELVATVTTMFAVRSAIEQRLIAVRDVKFYRSMPTYIETPAVLIVPDFPYSDMEQAFNSNYALWNVIMTVMVDRIDEDKAQEQIGEWIDPAGPFIGSLRSDDYVDSLSKLTHDVRVTTGGDFNEMNLNGTIYSYAQIRVRLKA